MPGTTGETAGWGWAVTRQIPQDSGAIDSECCRTWEKAACPAEGQTPASDGLAAGDVNFLYHTLTFGTVT